MKYSAKFHVFQLLTALITEILQEKHPYTMEQINAIHKCAEKIAADLMSGDYE